MSYWQTLDLLLKFKRDNQVQIDKKRFILEFCALFYVRTVQNALQSLRATLTSCWHSNQYGRSERTVY